MRPFAVLFLLVCVRPALAQVDSLPGPAQVEPVHLYVPRKALSVSYTPFGSIEVLDNRADTTKLYTIQNGRYPSLSVDLDTPVAVALREYMDAISSRMKRGNAHLLVKIERLSTPNTYPRAFFLFDARVYVQKGDDAYQPLLRVKKLCRNMHYSPFWVIEDMCNNLLEAAGVAYARVGGPAVPSNGRVDRLLEDTGAYVFAKPGPLLSYDEINRNVRDHWGDYPILQPVKMVSGAYPTFKDFRANRLQPGAVRMRLDPTDSLYVREKVQGEKEDRHDWALCDGRDLYMRLRGDTYVLLDRDETGVYFYVPRPSPDMYALLTRSQDLYYTPATAVRYTGGVGAIYIPPPPIKGKGGGGKGDVNAGTALIVVGALVAVGVAAILIDQSVKKHAALKRGVDGDYRYCAIDMDSGDILYDNLDYPLRPQL